MKRLRSESHIGSIGSNSVGSSNLKRNPSDGQNVMTFVVSSWNDRTISSSVCTKDEGAKFLGVRTIKWIGFLKLQLGFGGAIVGLSNFIDSFGRCFGSWLVVPNVSSGVSSKVSMCADSGCDEILLEWWMGWSVWFPGIEFPEGSRKVNRSSSPAALQGVSSGTLGHTMSSRLQCSNYCKSSALQLPTGSTEDFGRFGIGFSLCAAPNYLLSCAGVFRISHWKFEVIWKLEHT